MGGKGSGGKNRKPAAIKKAEGNRGKRTSKAAPVKTALPGEPAMPAFMTPRMRAVWKMMIPILKEKGVLTKDCGIALGTLCATYVHFSEAELELVHRQEQISAKKRQRDAIETDIEILSRSLGGANRRRSDLLRHLRAGYQAFGLDPSSDSGVPAGDPKTPAQMKTRFDQILSAQSDKDEVVN